MDYELIDHVFRGIAFAILLIAVALVLKGIRALWRWSRSFTIDGAARSAGEVTAAAKRKAAGVARSFKDGYRSH